MIPKSCLPSSKSNQANVNFQTVAADATAVDDECVVVSFSVESTIL